MDSVTLSVFLSLSLSLCVSPSPSPISEHISKTCLSRVNLTQMTLLKDNTCLFAHSAQYIYRDVFNIRKRKSRMHAQKRHPDII